MTDWIADGEAGSSVRAKLNSLVYGRQNIIPITTGPDPIIIDNPPFNAIYEITTGGTQGVEIVYLKSYPNEFNGYFNLNRITFLTKVMTDGGDIPIVGLLTNNDAPQQIISVDHVGNVIGSIPNANDDIGIAFSGVGLNDTPTQTGGLSATFSWQTSRWFLETFINSDGVAATYGIMATSPVAIRLPGLYQNSTVVIPKNYAIRSIFIQESAGGVVTGGFRIGTTDGGADVVAAQPVGAHENTFVHDADLLKRFFSKSVDTTLYLQAVTDWTAVQIEVQIVVEKILGQF